MLIRNQQLAALGAAARADYENRLASHLKEHFRHRAKELGDDGIRRAIKYGIGAAAAYGMHSEQLVARFLGIMFVFGYEFDTSEPWASQLLAARGSGDPADLMDQLAAGAVENLYLASGIVDKRMP